MVAVTNLNDAGLGSLRAACEAEGPRMVVFRVSGIIDLKSPIAVKKPYITIAGQTAPGDGVCLRGAGLDIESHDVVVRHLRVRPGDILGKEVDADEHRRRQPRRDGGPLFGRLVGGRSRSARAAVSRT